MPSEISKTESLPKLRGAWDKYKELYDLVKAQNIQIDNIKFPATIADPKIDYLGEITRTLELMAERSDKPITYAILIFGLIIDLILISFYSRTITIGTKNSTDDDIIDSYNG